MKNPTRNCRQCELMSPDDPRQPILELLQNYLSQYPREAGVVGSYLDFVLGNKTCFERSLEIGHVTGSAFLLDSTATRVLLTHHKKLGRWLQPGGHADGDTDVATVAMKEALEESGLESIRFVSAKILDVDIHEIPARKSEPAHFHYDCRFLLQSSGSDTFVISEESNDLAWVPINELTNYTDEDSILRMADKTKTTINGR